VSGNCIDNADRTGNATASNINIDKTAPTITFVSRTPANANDWNNGDVTLTWSCSDTLSGEVSSTVTQTISTEGANQSATGTCQDKAGNSASDTQNGINIDKIAPTLDLPVDFAVEATGSNGAPVTYSASASDLIDGSVIPSCSPASGSTFAIGNTTVECSAVDDAGNTVTGNFSITVNDATGPALALPADITAEATSASGAAVTYVASASDIVDGNVAVSCSPLSGSTFPLGVTTVNCSATDTRENTSEGTFTVTVQDTTAPVIAPKSNINSFNQIVFYSLPTMTDAVDGIGTATCTPVSGSTFGLGDTLITCTAIDSHKNVAEPVTFTIRVETQTTTPPGTGESALIPVTGGAIDLDCLTTVMVNDIRVTFHNLCDQQALLGAVNANNLPGKLPAGFTFVSGLDVVVVGQAVLPANTGIQMDFPIGTGQFAVLHWENGQWVEITQSLNEADLAKALGQDPANELYKFVSSQSGLFKTLTTENTGTFIVVKK
jgi:hypothetical protein